MLQVGQGGVMRLSVIDTRTAPSCLRHLPAVEILALGVDAELWLHIQTLNQARSIQKLQQYVLE